MEKPETDMAPKNRERLQLTLTDTQATRAERLAELRGERVNEVYRDALNFGLDEMEQRILQHLSFENALKVGAKLDRRVQQIHEAIAALEASGDKPEVVALLKESIGG